ncbi:SpoIIIAH-like family protein [Alkalihalobacterium chitinilyticum]|uniref:SpoIIIAH-like family protein n=1 Tax=Alkalihalobacterium chitinilyticum TaxID=2980103 RepID=A0ABT5V9X0_9BACI|nr:SpoIIIAH-like family protein [Alkalihalobacterium chitinilyticum]MDE5412250.1 SpoIIIAH-like family protein [Alkalihalobacterium chitinilyticum]
MVLKKQTVWLLTMLSLIVVLSVYYMTSQPQNTTDLAYMDEDMEGIEEMMGEEDAGQVSVNIEEDEMEEMMTEGNEEGEGEVEDGMISAINSDEFFTEIRLDREVSRSKMLQEYTNIIAEADVPAQVKVEALEKQNNLLALEQKENLLETLIRSKGYKDVLVLTEEEQVKIIVKADELSKEQANEILLMANEQLGERLVVVGHQPSK